MSMNFEQYAARGNEMINQLAQELDTPRDQAARILRSTLHALRNRLSNEENFDLLSQLPMMLKAIYVDGWKPAAKIYQSHHLDDFIDEIRSFDPHAAARDLGNNERAQYMVKGVVRILGQYVSQGEMNDVIGVLPAEIKDFFKSTLEENQLF